MCLSFIIHRSSFILHHSTFIINHASQCSRRQYHRSAGRGVCRVPSFGRSGGRGLVVRAVGPVVRCETRILARAGDRVVLCTWALRRIKRGEAVPTGRKLAWAGPGAFHCCFSSPAPTDWLVYRRIVRNEAQQFSMLWFRYLTHGGRRRPTS